MADCEVQKFLEDYESEMERFSRYPEEFAARSGWPTSLTVPLVKVLNALAAAGVPIRSMDVANALGVAQTDAARRIKHLRQIGLVAAVAIDGRRVLYTLSPVALSHLERVANNA